MNFTTTRLQSALAAALIAIAGVAGTIGSLPAHAAAPMAKIAAPGFYRMTLGDFEVTALSDGAVALPVGTLLRQPLTATLAALKHADLADPLPTSVSAYLVNTGTRLVLVDAGAGTLFGPTLGKLLANLKASGYQPEQIDDILITHMHPDHVGGLAAGGARVFVNAVVHADKLDADFWLSDANMKKAPKESQGFFQGAMASLTPYVDAGKFQPFAHDGELVPGIASYASHGHTAGHTTYVVESRGQRLLVLGDLIHVGAVQWDHPEVAIGFDSDTKAAIAARGALFGKADTENDLVAVAHLPFPGIGHLHAAGKAWRWNPVSVVAVP